jgi:hypothetical protein
MISYLKICETLRLLIAMSVNKGLGNSSLGREVGVPRRRIKGGSVRVTTERLQEKR